MKKFFILFALAAMVSAAMFSSCDKGGGSEGPDNPNIPTGGVEINGVVWATRNVGEPGKFVDKPEDFGMLYQFNRRTGWSDTDPLTSSPAGQTWNSSPSQSDFWTEANDPCPEGWRVPTYEELETLVRTYEVGNDWVIETDNYPAGRIFVDHNSNNSLFFPAAGDIQGNAGYYGFYWSSTGTRSSWGRQFVYCLFFADYLAEVGWDEDHYGSGVVPYGDAADGYPVRCVAA